MLTNMPFQDHNGNVNTLLLPQVIYFMRIARNFFAGSNLVLVTSYLLLLSGLSYLQPALAADIPVKLSISSALASTVIKKELEVSQSGEDLTITLYHEPGTLQAHAPAIVFLPGLMANVDQYESYAIALASQGFVVAVHEWYSPMTSDVELAHDAKLISDWLIETQGIDLSRIGIAGHSMGAKDAILAASQYGGFASIVAIDPDDSGDVSAVRDYVSKLISPLLLIGAEVAWKAPSICSPREENYQRFFEHSPAGTVELTLKDADHVQMLDDPERFGYTICRCGTADSRQVHDVALKATVAFLMQHLQSGHLALASMPEGQVRTRMSSSLNRPLPVAQARADQPIL